MTLISVVNRSDCKGTISSEVLKTDIARERGVLAQGIIPGREFMPYWFISVSLYLIKIDIFYFNLYLSDKITNDL